MPGENAAIFSDKAALIYGGAKGIGRAVACEFSARGASVAVADLDLDGARKTAALIEAAGGRSCAIRCDVTSEASVREAAVRAEAALGPTDIVMNNVGGILHGNVEDIPLSEWQRIWDLNLMPVVRSNAVFLPKMLARGSGFIVNTASFAGLYPFAMTRMPYVAAKAAVVALSESMALRFEPLGIRIACLCPGPVMTGVMETMKTWSVGVEMAGPGGELAVKSVDDAARTLADGMERGRILIPTHEEVWATLAEHWADPDAFIRRKSAAFAAGDHGRPRPSAEQVAAMTKPG
ncbi:MAG: SDR family oxidoreductase [Sphingomonadales bacterium]|nr:SDR family oxidoreductase [Sphingomonadales bacterium]